MVDLQRRHSDALISTIGLHEQEAVRPPVIARMADQRVAVDRAFLIILGMRTPIGMEYIDLEDILLAPARLLRTIALRNLILHTLKFTTTLVEFGSNALAPEYDR
jgi:hypothetical protein